MIGFEEAMGHLPEQLMWYEVPRISKDHSCPEWPRGLDRLSLRLKEDEPFAWHLFA